LRAGVTIITPNRRLAIALKRGFDKTQISRGTIWESADILPISAFVDRLYEDALYSPRALEFPLLLTAAQEQVLWEDAINRSDTGAALLAVADAAQLAREAWQLAHAWHLIPQLSNFPLNEDGKAFQDWSHRYEQATRRLQQIDRARLYKLVTKLCAHAEVRKPKRLVCYGFDIVTPQQAVLLSKLQDIGCEVIWTWPQSQFQLPSGNAWRVAYNDSSDEIHHAAVWARARIEASDGARIGIVVPEFSRYRSAIMRIFSTVMEPDIHQFLPGAVRRTLPFNASLGMPLSSYPLVSAVFLILDLGGREIEFERASLLLRSPFLGGGETEMTHRARLDVQLRKRAEPMITLERLLILIEREHGEINCPVLVQGLAVLAEFRKEKLLGSQTPSALARAISEALRITGFPGERDLDSSEYQTLEKWHEVLADFAALGRVVSRIGYSEGVLRLRRMTAETLFQPETPDVPIQILGVLEAAGMEFDHLWVMGLSDEAWPPQPNPNPFLPIELQRAAKLPHGSAVASLELARRLTDAWLSAKGEIILSHPQHSDDRDAHGLAPSPLIANVAVGDPLVSIYASHHDLIHDAGRLEYIHDDKAPALDPAFTGRSAGVSGGTAVIKDHAACPFRSLAVHRLGAKRMKTPHTGLNAMERGILVHHVLARAWSELKTKSALDAISDDALEAILLHAAKGAIARIHRDRPTTLSGRFAEIEQQRLVRLAHDWLDEERKRSGFAVIAIEDKRSIEIGGLRLSTCLDRVDELDDGCRIIIDYKTGAPSMSHMLGERPEEPQLPLYLVTAEPDAVAVAFAQIKIGDMRFAALARDSNLLPGVKTASESCRYDSWEELITAWRTDLVRIAASFSSGDAQVDPKKFPHTCRNCDLRSFCRIDERMEGVIIEHGEED
jgi:probable DNA repair protein